MNADTLVFSPLLAIEPVPSEADRRAQQQHFESLPGVARSLRRILQKGRQRHRVELASNPLPTQALQWRPSYGKRENVHLGH